MPFRLEGWEIVVTVLVTLFIVGVPGTIFFLLVRALMKYINKPK